ncbi:MAG: sugar kinase [Deltaproteobacteria bacterium]|nr:sugar kinase [Deltaproteobacteria bacterium]
MKKKYIIGIDGGTQSSKVIIFDLEGNVVCEGRQKLKPMHMPRPGVAEHPDDDLWDSIAAASRKAMAQFPEDLESILGMGLCTIRCCRACLKEDGSLASPVLNWMDLRLASPYEFTDPVVRYVTTSSGYITHCFTGSFKDTAANYEGMWPIDKDTWQWSKDPEVLDTFNVPRKNLLELVMPGSVLGYVTGEASQQTGLPAGLPVVATANDKAVEALGAGLLPGKTGLVSLGTYIGGMVYGQKNIKDAEYFFTNMASIPHRYLYESGGIRQGMWTVSWFRNLFGEGLMNEARMSGISPESVLNREAWHIAAGSDGLMTVPEWLAPPDEPFRKGIMIGFHAGHTRAHLYRSILEAIALTMHNHMDAMCAELNIDLDRVIVSGGGSSSDLFMRIFADVFGIPAIKNVVNGAAGLGAAICAAVAVGAYDTFDMAIEKMVRVEEMFQPVEVNIFRYREINNNVYKHITRFTDGILEKAEPVFNPKRST